MGKREEGSRGLKPPASAGASMGAATCACAAVGTRTGAAAAAAAFARASSSAIISSAAWPLLGEAARAPPGLQGEGLLGAEAVREGVAVAVRLAWLAVTEALPEAEGESQLAVAEGDCDPVVVGV